MFVNSDKTGDNSVHFIFNFNYNILKNVLRMVGLK